MGRGALFSNWVLLYGLRSRLVQHRNVLRLLRREGTASGLDRLILSLLSFFYLMSVDVCTTTSFNLMVGFMIIDKYPWNVLSCLYCVFTVPFITTGRLLFFFFFFVELYTTIPYNHISLFFPVYRIRVEALKYEVQTRSIIGTKQKESHGSHGRPNHSDRIRNPQSAIRSRSRNRGTIAGRCSTNYG